MKKRAGEDDGAKTGSRKQKDLKTGESKKMKRVRFTDYAQRRRSVRFRVKGTESANAKTSTKPTPRQRAGLAGFLALVLQEA
jgi:hypothetical protein